MVKNCVDIVYREFHQLQIKCVVLIYTIKQKAETGKWWIHESRL